MDDDGLRRLRDLPETEVVLLDEPEEEKERPLPGELLADVDVLACSLPPSNIEDLRVLRLVQIASAGYAQLVGIGLPQRGVRACNALGVFDVPIAEWNIAMMDNLLRDLRGMIRNQALGVWDRDTRFQRELRGLTVGFWGYGGIGRETARLAKALGMQVHVLTRSGVKERTDIYRVPGTGDPHGELPDQVFGMEQKMEFLNGLDFLLLAMPLTKSTTGIVGEAELRALRPTAYVLNPARGPLIQEQALLTALGNGSLAGAALDTHYHYPMPPEHPLWKMPNVIMTPHISGSSGSPFFLKRIWDILVQNVERLHEGRPLLNELREEELQ
ncbi:MAG: D-2-hydroxyacid dehydrogenase [Lentisphaerae bacterium]|nr:D-2-hydroxyacid dehydrogenase [Lentisphaerota bacterium]MBT4818993.1 D-2-hydroxyacid dehydrogenase [Lentisphaerota bacterium]MBT5611155.1 D-2-hydroxyacid dehydrogenase [Lentisphaerota bacterium]MBT7054721.1 D-2-hydroxyacid dehydrogenase [Lentisphaerota bacterium]MBT7841979.1 D-2-hydroxyacid dehydrogenase [Lentisphaerota bacterium]